MNKVILIGRLSKDVELKTISTTGSAVVNNTIATNRYRTSNTGEKIEETLFIDVVFFGRTAEVVSQYLRKGSKICVEGYLQQQSWVDSQTNQNRYKIQIVCESMEMLDSKSDNSANNQNYQNNYQNNSYRQNSSYQNTNNSYQNYKKENNFTQEKNNYNSNSADDAEIPF